MEGGENVANEDIRKYASDNGVKLWQIASALHINDGNFSRKLRYELSDESKEKIIEIIDELKVEDERSEKPMASLVQCDFCKKTFSGYDGFYYLHVKKRKEFTSMSEAKQVDEKFDICEECYQKIIVGGTK